MSCPDGKFAKKDRLIKTGDFNRVYKSGGYFAAGPFALKTLTNGTAFNRIGFSISARNVSSAVKRNRIRRLFREAFRKNKSALKNGFDMVLIVKRQPEANLDYERAKGVLLQLAKRAGILE